MKKGILIAIVAMMLLGTVSAQENQNSKTQFMVDFGIGTTSFINYPDVSLFQDPTVNYLSKISFELDFGLFNEGNFWGLEINASGLSTSALAVNEDMGMLNLALMYRKYLPLKNNIEASFGLKVGPSMIVNELAYFNEQSEKIVKYYYRWGLFIEPEFGVNYRFTNGDRIGISVAPFLCTIFKNNFDLPDNLPTELIPRNEGQLGSKESIGGLKLMFHLGF